MAPVYVPPARTPVDLEQSLLTPPQVANILSISRRQVVRLVQQGALRGYRVGRIWRFSRADLLAFLRDIAAGSKHGGGKMSCRQKRMAQAPRRRRHR